MDVTMDIGLADLRSAGDYVLSFRMYAKQQRNYDDAKYFLCRVADME